MSVPETGLLFLAVALLAAFLIARVHIAVERAVKRHSRKALRRDVPYLPLERSFREHPAHVRKIEHRVKVHSNCSHKPSCDSVWGGGER